MARRADVSRVDGTSAATGGARTRGPQRAPRQDSGGPPDQGMAPLLSAPGIRSLQRLAGNRAVCELLGRNNSTPQPAPGPMVVRRDVGLELEVQGTKLWTGPETDGTSVPAGPRVPLTYGTEVLKSAGLYDVEADDGRFEVVTKAFKETREGRQRLIEAVTAGAQVVTTAHQQATNRTDGHSSARLSELLAATGTEKTYKGQEDPWIGYFDDPSDFPGNERRLWAKPQATAAIPLARLGDLVTQMRTAGQSTTRNASSFTGRATSSAGRRSRSGSLRFLPSSHQLNRQAWPAVKSPSSRHAVRPWDGRVEQAGSGSFARRNHGCRAGRRGPHL